MALINNIFVNINKEKKRITKILRSNEKEKESLYQYNHNDIIAATQSSFYKYKNNEASLFNIIIKGLEKRLTISKISYTCGKYYFAGYYRDQYANYHNYILYSNNLSDCEILLELKEETGYPISSSFYACSSPSGILVIGWQGSHSRIYTFKNNTLINKRNDYTNDYLRGLCYGNGVFVYAVADGQNTAGGGIYYSTDGIHWRNTSVLPEDRYAGLCYRNKKFYVFKRECMYVLEYENTLNLKKTRSFDNFYFSELDYFDVSISDDCIFVSGRTEIIDSEYTTYYSLDEGETWVKYNLKRNAITYNENDKLFYIHTYDFYNGSYQYPYVETFDTKTKTKETLFNTYTYSSIYPNQNRATSFYIIFTRTNH